MSRFVKKMCVTMILFIGLGNAPILHENCNGYVSHFSIIDAIEMDIAEGQCYTPYFITHIIPFE